MKRTKISNNSSGIYQIQSKINRKKYIGSAVNLKKRKSDHFRNLTNINHINKHLQNHFNKYGKKDLLFSILEFCYIDKLIEREQYWINKLNPEFNINLIAGPFLGGEKNPMKSIELRNRMKGENNVSKRPEVRKKLREYRLGMHTSEETKRKQSKAKKGILKSEEHNRKNSEGKKKWWNSKEGLACKVKFSINNSGSNNPSKRPEVRQKQREATIKQWSDSKFIEKRNLTIKNRPILTCPHCKRQGKGSNMTRYHFNNCKYKKLTA